MLAQKVTQKGTTPDGYRGTNRLLVFVVPPAPGPAELAVRTFRGQAARRNQLVFYSPTANFTATATGTVTLRHSLRKLRSCLGQAATGTLRLALRKLKSCSGQAATGTVTAYRLPPPPFSPMTNSPMTND